MIAATTRLVALLGHPVAHSLSPRMQNAAFAARGLDLAYVALDVPPERLDGALRGLVELGFAGANVTAPHKQEVARLVGRGGAVGEHDRRPGGTAARASAPTRRSSTGSRRSGP